MPHLLGLAEGTESVGLVGRVACVQLQAARDLRAPPLLDLTSHLADGRVEALGGRGQSKVTPQVARGSCAQARSNFRKPTGA